MSTALAREGYMSKEKKTSKGETKPTEIKTEDKPRQDNGEFIKQLPAIITAIAGLLTALAGAVVLLNQAGLISFSSTPTPTPSFAPSPTWTSTLLPTDTPAPSETFAPTETPVPTPTATEAAVPTATLGTGCPWLPYSTLNPSITIGQNCLNDLLSLGISETDRILFYRESGMNIGVIGISRKVETGNEFSVVVSLKTLNAIRFLAVLSQKERGYQHSVGFRILRDGNKKLIQLVRFDNQGVDLVIANTPELDLWGGKLKLTLKFNGPQVRAYVNDAYFGQTQIEFIDRHLFLGYQVMSGGTSRPGIDLSVSLP